jgi:hypothetical protein
LTKKTIQQLSQKPFLFKLNAPLTLFFLDINVKAEIKPSFTIKGLGGGLIKTTNSKIIR